MSDGQTIEHEDAKKPSLVGAIVLPIIVLALAAGIGFAFAKFHVAPMIAMSSEGAPKEMMPDAAMDSKDSKKAGKSGHSDDEGTDDEAQEAVVQTIVPLNTIVTNLSDPSDVWVRADFSVVFDGPPESGMPEQILNDFVSYLRTTKLKNLEGSIGFYHLMDDLQERAQLISENKANKVLVRAFVVE